MQRLKLDPKLSCGNNSGDGTRCKKAGAFGCGSCLLVTYCSKECQTAHWPIHRQDCKSPLTKSTWEPSYFAEMRPPRFVGEGIPIRPEGRLYLWGEAPAIDVIRLNKNEGRDFQGSLDVLFAAPGNIRNAIISILNLPQDHRGPLNIVINDPEIAMAARSVIFLLIFFLEEDPTKAAEYVLHIWYSALVTETCYRMLQDKIKPMVKTVCDKIIRKASSTLFAKTWSFGDSSLRVVLTRDQWLSLLSHFDVPQGLDKDSSQVLRRKVTLNPDKIDHYEKDLCLKSPFARVAMAKFYDDGILLPFGETREEFIIPNPTMFHKQKPWPLAQDDDPTLEWPMKPAADFNIGPAKNDTYGKLYHYLQQLFVDFHARLRSLPVRFENIHCGLQDLADHLDGRHFDRIDARNLADSICLGVNKTLEILGPLLQPTAVNKHATLIAYFLNAINVMLLLDDANPVTRLARREKLTQDVLDKAKDYMPDLGGDNTSFLRTVACSNLLYDMDEYFNRYIELHSFTSVGISTGLQMKDKNTIIKPWPLKVPGGKPTKKVQEYFALLLASGHTGQERYVEWKRTTASVSDEVD
ncbi:hypothetical protein K449DRAFT_339298 [Hypoxylon sp. EC38]|nr:hypothetical protein K449DRAFT_339298 [Hypoxylon sp. EC38]